MYAPLIYLRQLKKEISFPSTQIALSLAKRAFSLFKPQTLAFHPKTARSEVHWEMREIGGEMEINTIAGFVSELSTSHTGW